MAAPQPHIDIIIAGVRISLRGEISFVRDRAEKLTAFLGPAPHDLSVAIDVVETKGPPTGSDGDFTYVRADLAFGIDVQREHATAALDDSVGAFEAMLELALQTVLLRAGGLVVHASCGVLDQAWLMPGPSGAGKSTAARGGFGRVLSDEMVVVRRTADGWRAYGTPFWSEGRQMPYDAGSAPLGVLARLNKAPRIAVDDLQPDDAVAHLLRCVALYEESGSARGRAFDLACELVGATRCVELTFPKEGTWAAAAARLMQERSSSTR